MGLTLVTDTHEVPGDTPAPDWHEDVSLRDGTRVTIRPIRLDDAPRLQALFGRLSPESVYLRFLACKKALPDKQAQDLVTVDYRMRMALVAILGQDGGEHIIGVARYSVIQEESPELAEPAIVVEDRYQGRGLGKILFKRLIAYARAHRICAFLAYVHSGNTKFVRLARDAGLPVRTGLAVAGVREVHMLLEPEADLAGTAEMLQDS